TVCGGRERLSWKSLLNPPLLVLVARFSKRRSLRRILRGHRRCAGQGRLLQSELSSRRGFRMSLVRPTLALTCCRKRERGTSGRWRQSGAVLGSVQRGYGTLALDTFSVPLPPGWGYCIEPEHSYGMPKAALRQVFICSMAVAERRPRTRKMSA